MRNSTLSHCRDSVNFYNVLKLRDSISLKLHVKQLEFVIMQGFDNQNIKSAIIYTENLDKNYLDQLVDIVASVDLHANSEIKVLSLSNNY